jgi:pectate lyase
MIRLVSYLSDSTPRVIMLDRTFDFLQTEGSTTTNCCSDDRTTKCPGGTSQGQLWIQTTCDGGSWQSCTYWNAPRTPLKVASNKSIVGVGTKGVIRGKGLRLTGGVSNVIIQNIHITVSDSYIVPPMAWTALIVVLKGTEPSIRLGR